MTGSPHAVIFAGPTLVRARAIAALPLAGVEVLPPVARGDLPRLVAGRSAATVAIVDGVFHARLALGHAEVRDALAAGWTVWGLSSLGAIRACEMQHLGMRGFGDVYRRFVADGLRDDEVTLLHGPGPEFRELSEPLVHLRAALDAFVARGDLDAAYGAEIASELAGMYFGERTLERFADLVSARAARPFDVLAGFDTHRIKCHDLHRFAAEVLMET
jgi:hypothetical protein